MESIEATGNEKVLSSFSLFGYVASKVNMQEYELYELSVVQKYPFNNFFLPILQTKYIYREMKRVEKFVPFETVEMAIKEEAKALAMQNVDSACQIVNIDYTIRREGSIVKVDCFIESLENIAG